jgi:hypothetical protein
MRRAGAAGLGAGGLGSFGPVPGMGSTDMAGALAAMQNPAMQQAMQAMMANPGMMEAMTNAAAAQNPQLRQMLDANPSLRWGTHPLPCFHVTCLHLCMGRACHLPISHAAMQLAWHHVEAR